MIKVIKYLIFIVPVLLLSCFDNSSRLPSDYEATSPFGFPLSATGIRVVNLSPNSPQIDFIYASKTLLSKSVFKQASPSVNVGTISRPLQIKELSSNKIVKETTLYPKSNKLITAILWDKYEFRQVTVIESDPQKITSPDKSRIRFFLGTKDIAPKVDIRVKNKNNSYAVDGLAIGEMSNYFDVDAGSNEIMIFPNSTNYVALSSLSGLEAGKVYTAFIGGLNSSDNNQRLGIFFINETSYQQQDLFSFNEGKTEFRFVQASLSGSSIDVLVDNILRFSSIPYRRATRVTQTQAGSRNFKLVLPGSTSVKTEGTFSMNMNKFYMVTAHGNFNTGLELLVSELTKQVPNSDKSAIRLLHVSPNSGILNFVFKGSDNKFYYSSANYKSVTNSLHIPAGVIDLFVINAASKDTLKKTSIFLDGGKSYSGFIVPKTINGTDFYIELLDDSNEESQDLFGSY